MAEAKTSIREITLATGEQGLFLQSYDSSVSVVINQTLLWMGEEAGIPPEEVASIQEIRPGIYGLAFLPSEEMAMEDLRPWVFALASFGDAKATEAEENLQRLASGFLFQR